MKYERRYLQFNDLVFDGFDMISDYDGDLSFKGSSIDISFGHGKYRPFKADYLFVDERTVSMTITLKMLKLPCEYRPYYNQFAIEQLSKPGRLWSIKNNELQWAFAAVTNISEEYSGREDTLVYDINFVIPGGVWHKADKQKTFLVPWDVCLFMECMDYMDYNPCKADLTVGDCCEECLNKKHEEVHKEDCYCCCVDKIKCEMALCYNLDKLESFYTCNVQYQLVYDCEKAKLFNNDKYLGEKFCTHDICEDSIITGRFYSETDIPTDQVTVTISGKMSSPWITINGNTNVIEGEYDGTLIVKPNGDVYFQRSDGCCEPQLLDPSVWVVPAGNVYGWTVYPRENPLLINLNSCCVGRTCAWIYHDAITM